MMNDGVPVELWEEPAPESLDWTHDEQWEAWSTDQFDEIVRNVVVPNADPILHLPSIEPCSVAADAPPLFVLAAADDMLGIQGSLDLHARWRTAGAPVKLHLFERGNHGFATSATGLPVDRWPDLLVSRLESVSSWAS